MNTALKIEKPQAASEVDASLLDAVVEKTEHRMAEDAVLHVYSHLDAYLAMADGIVTSGMTHHKRKEHVVTIAIAAKEMGLGLMTALRGMYLVGGKIAMETWLMDMIAISRGVTKTVHENTNRVCRLTLHREGWDDLDSEFTIEKAAHVGLVKWDGKKATAMPGKAIWVQYTEEMLYWRALSSGLRKIAPDIFGGIYTADEAGGIRDRSEGVGEPTDTNAELDALMEKGTAPVDPDTDELTQDEIDTLRQELNAAEKAGLIDADFKADTLDAATKGPFAQAREAWDTLRGIMARAEAEAEQGGLPL